MVIGDKDEAQPGGVTQMPPASIDNIMSGISNTGSVKMNNHRKKLRQRFDIIKKLGQGTYGKVQLGINKETSQDVAIKTIKKCKIETEADLVRIRREVQIMSSVQHPNIIHIYEVFENREKMVLVMEFAAGGELYDYLSERKVLTEDEARRIFRQIATAVYYCHKHKICHRDLKLENILLDEHGNAKIADFGLSNVFEEKRLLATFCGSPLYASPEIVKGTPYQGPEVDCWSLGVLLYTLVYGAMPFDGSNFKRLVKQISAGDYYEPKKPSNASPLIREMLTVCPKRRATIEQICNHWWVNESYTACCLNLAEELANQTPVRLDVLLSLAPPAVTSEQLVVPNPHEIENKQNVTRSMSVGSVRELNEIANTEAEQRIIDMVAAGGEAALAPSPTRTITPSATMVTQVKRKPENTISTESMTGARKRDKPTEQIKNTQSKLSISEVMNVDESAQNDGPNEKNVAELSSSTLPDVVNDEVKKEEKLTKNKNKGSTDTIIEEVPPTVLQKTQTSEPKPPKTFAKTKTTDLSEVARAPPSPPEEKVPEEPKPSTERRKSRIMEAAERFEAAATAPVEKPKKFVVKKDVERKTSAPQPKTTSFIEKPSKPPTNLPQQSSDKTVNDISKNKTELSSANSSGQDVDLAKSDSKNSNLSLEEARRSMENSIALLNQAKIESSNEVEQLCAKTENVAVSSKHDEGERQRKLKNAREIIGNAIPRFSGMGVRKPPVPFGANGRSISGSVVPSSTRNVSTPPDPRLHERESPLSVYGSRPVAANEPGMIDEEQPKVSSAEITLKSATLPRRKIGRPDVEQQQQYHPTYNPVFATSGARGGVDLEPQQSTQQKPKEHYIPIQRVGYVANTSSSQRSVLSRQSTNDSDTSDTQTASTATIGTQPSLQTSNSSSQPIKKSPREFIIPIAVEGGGFVTPRAGSLEPSESNHSTSTAFSRFSGRPRKISSIFNDSEDESINSPFHRMQRHTSIGRDSDTETNQPSTGFTYRLRSTRPFKKLQAEGNDSGSSGEEDDEDGFEILTAENLFSTLLSRVRALTNRLNVKDDPTSDFPSARFLNNFRQTHSPFWQNDPFSSRLNSSGAWRHGMTRDLGTDIDSVFSPPRTGATLPKGAKFRSSGEKSSNVQPIDYSTSTSEHATNQNDNNLTQPNNETLDLADLDLSQLRLTKKDLETLSSITPSLPKHFQDQLLAQLPPNQARKLSRTLSMQATARTPTVYKRSLSSGREGGADNAEPAASKTSNLDEEKPLAGNDEKSFAGDEPPSLLSFDRNSVLRRSMSRGRDPAVQRRSTSALRNEYPSTRMSYTGDLRSDYNATKPNDSLASRYRLTDYTSGISSTTLRPEYYSKLPLPTSSALSPQKSPSNEALESPFRRRSSRGLSRLSRPDFYGSASSINATDDNALLKVRGEKERETQNVLREIRERSRDRSSTMSCRNESHSRDAENLLSSDGSINKDHRRKSSIPNIRITVDKQNGRIYHTHNKSMERCCDIDDTEKVDGKDIRRASMTNSRSCIARPSNQSSQKQSASEFTDDILSELVRRSKEYTENGESPQRDENKDENGTVKKTKVKTKDGKKTKSKPKEIEIGDNEAIVKKTNNDLSNEVQSVTLPLPKSKIARRLSYLSKEESENDKKSDVIDKKVEIEANGSVVTMKSNDAKEAKAYPNSKLTPPKEVTLKVKKSSVSNSIAPTSNTRNAITAVMEKFIEKSTERLSPGKSMTAIKIKSDSGGEISPPKTKKKVKVVKKLAKNEQSPTKEPSPKSNETSNETSPVKERKSPEKKSKSGFLYSIGQKFEKMRENSKNKEKEKKIAKVNETPVAAASEIDIKLSMSTVEKELAKDVETVQTIIIPRRVKDGKGETIQKEEITIRQIELPPSISVNSIAKGEQRKSRIDAVIRNLRERSVPHTVRVENCATELATESGLLKRAVSVEDMTNGAVNFNKQGNVNKVLGLFRRIEKEHQIQNQQQQQQQQQQQFPGNGVNGESTSKERPRSGGFVSKMKKSNRPYYTGAKSDTIVTLTDQFERQYLSERATNLKESVAASSTKIPFLRSSSISKPEAQPVQSNNFEFMTNGTKENTPINGVDEKTPSRDTKRVGVSNEVSKPQISTVNVDAVISSALSEKERIRNNRKGLVLDLNNEQYNDHFKKISNDCSNNNNSYHFDANGKSLGNHCNGSNENHVNNNFAGNGNYYPQFYPHSERSHEPYTPTCDLATNYSSDNRSMRDDCESTSTFLSPTDEPELCFDDWSACSGSTDDHLPLHPKHLKYASTRNQSEQNHNQPSTSTDAAPSTPSDSESVIDRIKRRSYYCRFNEKKPKRTSSIVGPNAQREYYRDMANKSKSRASDYLPLTPNGFQTDHLSDGSYSRGGSKSPTPMNLPSMNFKESSSRANTPGCYSNADESEKYKHPQYHYHFHQRSQTPSRSVKSSFDHNDVAKNKSSEYLNLRSTLTSPPAAISVSKYYSSPVGASSSLQTSDYQHNGNRSYGLRNSAYDSLTTPIVYGTYNPKRRLSTSYLAPAIATANSTNGYSSIPKDHLSTSCYATLGRSKPKSYDHRSLTMLDAGSITPSSILSKRIGSTHSTLDNPYTHSHYRPVHDYGHFNSRSNLRSPTIIPSSTSNV